jgi:putative ABC transport system ATP-binding protein
MQLSVANVGLSYDDAPVLKDVSFELPSGDSALLLGPSGSGKSSLLNIICGLQSADTGSVTLGGRSICGEGGLGQADDVRRTSMGIVFQTLRLVSALTLRANLLLAQKLQTGSHDGDLIDATLAKLDIADRANAKPYELSQGEAQRAAIARALVVKPKLLIADEPTSALDGANTRRVAELLLGLATDSGASLLVATHDDRLKPYFGRTLSLSNGSIVA